jgi:hypothetical protein
MRQDAKYFENREPVLIYIAKRLREALRLESVLTSAAVDYGVEADHYHGGIIFRRTRVGAFFYVLPESVESAHRTMREHGYKPYEEPSPALQPDQTPE